jgi:hypothetical protein
VTNGPLAIPRHQRGLLLLILVAGALAGLGSEDIDVLVTLLGQGG